MNLDQQQQTLRHRWLIAALSVSALIALMLLLYQQTVLYLAGLWNNYEIGEYGHGYLVLAISAYLIVRNRRNLLMLEPCPAYWMLAGVMAATLLWLVAVLVDVNMMQTVALLILLIAIVWTIMGSRVAAALLLPLLFIGFAIPLWFPISPLLQDLTADVVFWFIRILEVPAFREENMIVVPAGRLSVEEACSGLRYFLAALTLGTLYAYLNYKTLGARVTVVLIAAATAVLANFVRVFIVVYLGYATDMQHPYVHDHLMLGWYLFGGLVAVLLIIDASLYRRYQRANPGSSSQAEAKDVNAEAASCNKGKVHFPIVVVASALILAAGPAVVHSINSQSGAERSEAKLDLPTSVDDWSGSMTRSDDWVPEFHGAIDHKLHYDNGNDQVAFYLGYFPVQQQGEELINALNSISNQEIWRTHYPRARLKQAGDLPVLEQLLKNDAGQQRLVWYWYSVAGRDTTSKYEAKLLQVLGLLSGQTQAYVAAVAMDQREQIDQTRNVLRDFVTAMHQPLQQATTAKD